MFDVTGGILAAGAVAALGFVVLPMQRRRAVRDFSARVEALRGELREALQRELGEEVDAAVRKVRTLVDPVRTLVASQRERLGASAAQAERLAADADAIRADVRQQFGEASMTA